MCVTVRTPAGQMLYCKGAPDVLLGLCTHIAAPAGVRAMGLPLLAGTLCAASTATGLTGCVWARLRARRAGK